MINLNRVSARRAFRPAVFALAASVSFILPTFIKAQTYSSGQPVWPAFEGWEKNDDGSFNLVFGYMNDNWEEQPYVPIGPDNNIQPGGPDQGQPTRFQPRRNRFMFRVRVPKDFGQKELVWTLTTQGKAAEGLRFAATGPGDREHRHHVGDRCPWRRREQPRNSRGQAARGQDRGSEDADRQGRSAALADDGDNRRRRPALATGPGRRESRWTRSQSSDVPSVPTNGWQEPRVAHVVVRLSWWWQRHVRARPDQSLGRHPERAQILRGHRSGLRRHSRPTANRPSR